MCILKKKRGEADKCKEEIISVSFYKNDGNWYADIPGISEEDAIITEGGEAFLDRYCKGMHISPVTDEKVTIKISTKWNGKAPLFLEYKNSNPEGHMYSLFTNGINHFSRAFHDIGGIMVNGYIMDLNIRKNMDSMFPEPPKCISIY